MADRYWVGGTASWDGTAGTKWSTTSGGAGGASVPTSADDVFFDSNSTGTVTISAGNTGAKSINCTGFSGTITGTAQITVAGSVTLSATMTYTHNAAVVFTGSGTLTTAGKTFSSVTINGSSANLTLGDALNISTRTLTVTQGTFDTANYAITAGLFTSTGSSTRSISLGSSTVTLSSGVLFNNSVEFTFNAGTSSILCGGIEPTFDGGGQSFYNVSFTGTQIGVRSISGTNTFNNLTLNASASGVTTLSLQNNQTVTGVFTCSGSSVVNRAFIKSNIPGVARTLTVNTLLADDCDFQDISIAGTATGTAPIRAGDCGGNSGVVFPAPKTVYFTTANTGTSPWSSAVWATIQSVPGTVDVNNFPLAQDTAIVDNTSSPTSGVTISVDYNWNVGTIDMDQRSSSNLTFNTASAFSVYGDFILDSGVTLSGSGAITFAGRQRQIVLQANQFSQNLIVNTNSDNDVVFDSVTSNAEVILLSGNLHISGTIRKFSTSGTLRRTLAFNTNLFVKGSAEVVWNVSSSTNFYINADSEFSAIIFNGSSTKDFYGGGASYPSVLNSGGGTLVIYGNNYFTKLGSEGSSATLTGNIILEGGTTQTIEKLDIKGYVTAQQTISYITLSSTGANSTIVAYSGIQTAKFVNISNITPAANGISAWFAIDCLGVSSDPRWIKFGERYWVGGNSTWDTSSASWAYLPNGTPGTAPAPTSSDNVIFNDTVTVTLTSNVSCNSIIMNAGAAVTLAASATRILDISGSWLAFSVPTVSTNIVTKFKAISYQNTIDGNYGNSIKFGTDTDTITLGQVTVTSTGIASPASSNSGWTKFLFGNRVQFTSLDVVRPYNRGQCNLYFRNSSGIGSSITSLNFGTNNGFSNYSNRVGIIGYESGGPSPTIQIGSVSNYNAVDFQNFTNQGTGGNAAIAASTNRSIFIGNLGGNSGINFPTAITRYLSNAFSHDFSLNSSYYSATSGGAAASEQYLLAHDTCIIDNNSGNFSGMTNSGSNYLPLINASSRTNPLSFGMSGSANTFLICRNFTGSSGISFAGNNYIVFDGTSTFNSNGLTYSDIPYFYFYRGVVTLGSAFSINTDALLGPACSVNQNSYSFTSTRLICNSTSSLLEPRSFTINTGVRGGPVTFTGFSLLVNDNFGYFGDVTSPNTCNITYNGSSLVKLQLSTDARANFNFTTGSYPLDISGTTGSVNFTGFSGVLLEKSSATTIKGNLTLSSGMSISGIQSIGQTVSQIVLDTTNAITLTTLGKIFPVLVNFSGNNTVALNGDLTVTAVNNSNYTLFVNSGITLNLQDNDITTQSMTFYGSTLNMGTGQINLTGGKYTISSVWVGGASTSLTGSKIINLPTTTAKNTATIESVLLSGNLDEAAIPTFVFPTSAPYFYILRGSFKNLNFVGTSVTGFYVTTGGIRYFGNLTLKAGMTVTGNTADALTLIGGVDSTQFNITAAGVSIGAPIILNCPNETYTLQDALTCTQRLTLTNGTLNLNGYSTSIIAFTTATGIKTLNFNGSTLNITGSGINAFNNAASANFTVTNTVGNAVINMTSSNAKTFVGGGVVYPVRLNQGGVGALTITGNNTFTDISNSVQPTTITLTGTSTNVSNLSLSGTNGNLVTISGGTITRTAYGVMNLNYLSISSSTVQGAVFRAFNSTNGGSNTGWLFSRSLYWVGGFAAWDGTAGTKWSTTSGGAGGAAIPTVADDVYFNASSGAEGVTITASATCFNLDCTGFTGGLAGSSTLTIGGNLTLAPEMVFIYNGVMTFTGSNSLANFTINTAGKTLGAVTFNSTASNTFANQHSIWTLQSALTSSGIITVTQGSFDTGSYALTATLLSSSGTTSRVITLGNSLVTLSSATPIIFTDNNNLQFNAGTSTINATATSTLTFDGGSARAVGVTFYDVNFTGATVSNKTISGINTFNRLSTTGPATNGIAPLVFNARQIINGGLATTNTTPIRRVLFCSSNVGIQRNLEVNSLSSLTDADFRDIHFTGNSAVTGTRIGDAKGNTGSILFSTPKTVFRVNNGTGTWAGGGWATTSGGVDNINNYPLAQDTAVINNSSVSASGSIVIDTAVSPYIGSIEMSTRTSALTLTISGTTLTVFGNWTNGTGLTLSGAAPINIAFSGRNLQTITTQNRSFVSNIVIDSLGGTVQTVGTLTAAALTVTNGTFDSGSSSLISLTNISSSNSNVRAIKLNSSTVTFASIATVPLDFTTSTNLNFDAGTSYIQVNGDNTTFNGGGENFNTVYFASANSGSHTITGNNTFNTLVIDRGFVGVKVVNFNADQTINTLRSSSTFTDTFRRVFFKSNILGTPRTLTVNDISGAINSDFRDIVITGAASGSSISAAGDCGGNSGINFAAPKTVFTTTSGSWGSSNWSLTPGGAASGANLPLAHDIAIVQHSMTMNGDWNIGTVSTTSSPTISIGNTVPIIYGNLTLNSTTSWTDTAGTITFSGRNTQTITSAGRTISCNVAINKPTSADTVQLADALSVGSTRTLTVTSGTFNAVTYNVTTGIFAMTGSNAVVAMGSGTWSLSTIGTVWNVTAGTLLKGTADIVLASSSTSARTFAGNSLSYNKLTIGGNLSTSTTTITGNNQFTELASTKTVAHTIAFGATTQTFGKWTVSGTAGNVVTLTGNGPNHILAGACTSGINYLAMGSIGFSTSSPGEFYAGPNSTGTAAAPVYRTAKPADSVRYWVGGTGNWSSSAKWSTSSGGAGGASVPRSHDDVIFDSASSATSYTATVDTATGGVRMKSLTIAGPASGSLTLAGNSTMVGVHGNFTLPSTGLTRTFTGGIVFSGSTTGNIINTNGVVLNSGIEINGVGCGWVLGSALNIGGLATFTLTNGTFDTSVNGYALSVGIFSSNNTNSRTLILNSSSISAATTATYSYNFANSRNLTIDAGTSTLNSSASGQGIITNTPQTFYNYIFGASAQTCTIAGSNTFNDVTINAGGATINIMGSNLFNNLTISGRNSSGISNIALVADQTINGTLTISAGTNATMRQFLRSSVIGVTRTLTCGSVSVADVDFRDITIAGAAAPVSGTRLGDCKGNSGISFDSPKTVYRTASGGSTWFGTSAWATTPGGVGSNDNYPLPQDTAVFTTAAPSSITIDTANIGTIDLSARVSGSSISVNTGTGALTIYGNWINGTSVGFTGSGTITFAGRSTQTITSGGSIFTQPIEINSPGGSVSLQDSFITSQTSGTTFALNAGNFVTNNYNVTLSGAGSSFNAAASSLPRALILGSSTWTVAGLNGWNTNSGTNFTFSAANGTINMTSPSSKSFQNIGGIDYSGITLNQGGAGTLTISGGDTTFKDITSSYSLTTGPTTIALGSTTQRVSQFTATGSAATRRLTITGTSAASPGTLIVTGETKPNVDYLDISNVRVYSLTDTWYAGNNSINNGSLGWIYKALIIATGSLVSSFFLFF